MRAIKRMFIIGCFLFAAVVGFAIIVILTERADRKVAIVNDTSLLVQLVSDWKETNQLFSQDVTDFITGYESPYKSYKLFVFTNEVEVGGTNYRCAFGMQDTRFSGNETLAITPEEVVILINKNGNQVIYSKHN